MSADNWTQCPRCYETNRVKAEALEVAAGESYGKVPVAEYLTKVAEANSFRKAISSDDNFTSTLREDYDIGIEDGEFSVGYRAQCSTCGFDFKYKHEEKVK